MAMTEPGMFLSQPTTATIPSYDIPPITVSIESAIKSLEGNEKRIPGVPIDIPSLTPMVLKIRPTKSASWVPFFISTAKSLRCMLHGFPSYPVLAIPTKGFSKSASVRPIA